MIPFLHLGPLAIPTFGLMVALAMIAAYYVLRADLARRGIAKPDSGLAEYFITIPCLAGIIGARLYHALQSPADLVADPVGQLFSRYGFAWFGGLIAGFAGYVWVARWKKIPLLTALDAGSPAAALGYGIGRIGCLLSGDGDYGVPTSLPWGMSFPNGLVPTTDRVHPTPIYEFIAACADCLDTVAARRAGNRKTFNRSRFRRVSIANGRCALPSRIHPHQPARGSGNVKRASRQRAFDARRSRALVVASQTRGPSVLKGLPLVARDDTALLLAAAYDCILRRGTPWRARRLCLARSRYRVIPSEAARFWFWAGDEGSLFDVPPGDAFTRREIPRCARNDTALLLR